MSPLVPKIAHDRHRPGDRIVHLFRDRHRPFVRQGGAAKSHHRWNLITRLKGAPKWK